MGLFSPRFETLRDLYLNELRDLYSAETQLVEALPKMADAATSSQLKGMRAGNAIYAGGGWIWQVLSDGKSKRRTQKVSSALQR
jgi:hypothetical protein